MAKDKNVPKKIRLKSIYVNRDNEEYDIILETEGEIYFYNWADMYCYFLKSEEGSSFEYIKENETMKVWDFMPAFVKALTEQLEADDARWGDTWRRRGRQGHEERIESDINNYFDQYRNAGTPVPWLKIAGLAMIAWIRETQEGWAIEK